jgi:hypothetical protein
MKKMIILLILLFSLALNPAVASTSRGVVNYAALSTEDLAYTDIDSAPISWKDDIITARNTVIFNSSWTVNGQGAGLAPDGTIIPLPEFSDLFPNWDIPTSNDLVKHNVSVAKEDIAKALSAPRSANFVGIIRLVYPDEITALPFYTFLSSAKGVVGTAVTLPGDSYNFGFVDVTNGGYLVTYHTRMSLGYAVILYFPNSNIVYGACASTFSTEGAALLEVYDSNNII